jgi:pilus assembly protein CpaC
MHATDSNSQSIRHRSLVERVADGRVWAGAPSTTKTLIRRLRRHLLPKGERLLLAVAAICILSSTAQAIEPPNPMLPRARILSVDRGQTISAQTYESAQPIVTFDSTSGLVMPTQAFAQAPNSNVQFRPGNSEPINAPPPGPIPTVPNRPDEIPSPFEMQHPRLELLGDAPSPLGKTPKPSPEVAKQYAQFVEATIDPQNTFDLVLNRPRILVLKQTPKRVQVADEKVATYTVLTDHEISIVGQAVGTTVLNLWFADPANAANERILSYLIRVIPDPEAKERLDRMYKALAVEINEQFPNSFVELTMAGDKLVVRGEAIDALEATQILMVIRANTGNQGGQGPGTANIPVGAGGAYPINQAGIEDNLIAGAVGVDAPGAPSVNSFALQGSNNIINLLKIPGEQQIMLRVTVAEVNRTAARSIGMNFAVFNQGGTPVFGQFTGGLFGTLAAGALPGGNLPALLDNGQVALAIQALRTLTFARALAEPNLVTVNGRPANFQAGGEFPIPAATATFGAVGQGVQFVPYGVALQFIPYITDRDRIRLQIVGRVSTIDSSTQATVAGTTVPGLQARTFSTTLELREGQTLAMAGLIQNAIGGNSNRVPFFGDLPIVGRAFAFDKSSSQELELVVLITPELVHPMECKEIPPLPGADVFEPGDLEFFLGARLESRRTEDFRSSARTDLPRLMRYIHCEDIYILGPHGPTELKPGP